MEMGLAMVIEKVVKFVRVNNGALAQSSVDGPRIVMISLPRVRFIEGSDAADKYFMEGNLSAQEVATKTGAPLEKIESFLVRRENGKLTKGSQNER